jgi:hypothetical protein
MKIKFLIIILCIVFLTGTLFALDMQRKIHPVIEDIDLILTKSLYNQTYGMDRPTQQLVYVCYLAGFLDAMQLECVHAGIAKQFITDCQGLSLQNLMDMMIKFKDEHPQWRNVSPATMLTVAVPRIRQGLVPFPESKEQVK